MATPKHALKTNVLRFALELHADTLTPVLSFLRLARAGQRSFLLESVEGGERLGRYSFLGVDPIETLRVRDGAAWLERDGHKTRLCGNPFHAIGQHLARYRGVNQPGLPPFQGGAIGYIGYECAAYLESIPAPAATAADRDRDQACVMVFRDVVAFDHLKRRVFVICNVFTDDEPAEKGLRAAKARAEKLRERLYARTAGESGLEFAGPRAAASDALADVRAAMGRARYVDAVKTIKSHIRAGDIFQCVLSDQFELGVSADPLTIYRALQAVNPSPYLYYLSLGQDVLLGASPEMLVRATSTNSSVSANPGNSAGSNRGSAGLRRPSFKIETCPIAGTRPRGPNDAADRHLERDLLKSVKERAEHLMLVDLGRNDIGRVAAPGSVDVATFMQVQRFSHVMHLVSVVTGRLAAGLSAWDALASCFPAGTLSGAPKIRAMQIIAELEPVRRNAYGGAVVYHDFSGQLDSCITIRSLFVRGRKAWAQAGAGIVADSNPQAEYDEVLHKLKAVRRAVALADAAARGSRARK